VDLGGLLQSIEGSAGGGASLPAAIAIFVQEAGVPLPLPIGGLLLFLGYRDSSGPLTLLALTLIVVEVASVLGASVKYWFGLKGGRPLLYTYGRYVRLKAERVRRSERQFREHGTRAIVLGRAVPGVSMIVPLAAGALGMPFRRFLPALAAGSGINVVVFVMVGFLAGPKLIGRLIQLGLSIRVLATLALLAAVAGALAVLRRRAPQQQRLAWTAAGSLGPVERSLVAGLIAMFEMGAGINLVLYAIAIAGLLQPQQALVHFLDLATHLAGGGPDVLVALIVLFVAGGLAWSLLYTLVAVRYLPGPPAVRGLLFAAAPFATSMALLAALGFGPLGLGLGAGLIPLAGELTRCALFGVGLGTAERMLRPAEPDSVPAGAATA
jgi:membrane protein DedA with SNARE-associated domain